MDGTLRILDETTDFAIVEGVQAGNLLGRLNKLSLEEKNTLLHEASIILSNCNNPIETIGSKTGIAVGYVQSGKTMSFTLLTALAIDNGFRIVIYFAGIKLNLLEQTTKRLKKDLLTESDNSRFYKVYQSPNIKHNHHVKIQNALKLKHKPAILITVLKKYTDIDPLTAIFNNPEVKEALGNNGVLIIDDEADQASLNTYARKNSKSEDWEDDEYSSTYASILNLKAAIVNHSYIQYTATPQGPLLINMMDLLSPNFHVILTPGQSYTGGKAFFVDNPDLIITIPNLEVYHHKTNPLADCPQSLVNALQIYFMSVAIVVNILGKEKYLSMMIHADKEQDASKKFFKWVKDLIINWAERLKLPDDDPSKIELVNEFLGNYRETVRRNINPPGFSEVMKEVLEVILDTNTELVIQGSREIDWSNSISHILVGADMLNRGFTVEGLLVTYMPRFSAGKSNADTIQQRCRFFGYKKNYLDYCRVFLPNDSIMEYREYIDHEEIMRQMLSDRSLQEMEQLLILHDSMNPTRNNILSIDVISNKMNGWRQMNALHNIEENIVYVEKFIEDSVWLPFKDYGTPDRNHRYIKLTMKSTIEFLKDFKISNMPDALRKSSTIQYLRYLTTTNNLDYAYIIEMSYSNTRGRERKLETDNGRLKFSNIFSGRSTAGEENYPGDKAIRFEDSLCIQIHRIKVKSDASRWANKIVYTLGIYYPDTFVHSFVGVAK